MVPTTSVDVDVVLFRNSPGEIARLVRGITGMARHTSSQADPPTTINVLFGDCSPEPIVPPDALERIHRDVEKWGAAVVYEFFGQNLGTAGGNNALSKLVPSDFVLVLNPDTFPAPDCLSELVSVMRAHPTVGLADARQIPLEHPKWFDPANGTTPWASGACMLQRREALEAVGGYDDRHFFLMCDDVDLSWRVRLAGYRLVHVPQAIVFHDKKIGDDGHPLPGAVEDYWALLGRLMLATRYGRSDIVSETIRVVEERGTERQQSAVAEYKRRRAANDVPTEIAGAERVAEFTRDEYGIRRF